jgi:hypothetical protein
MDFLAMHDDETVKLMFDQITKKLSVEAIGHLDGLHLIHTILHGTVDKLGEQILAISKTGSVESEETFWDTILLMRTILEQQQKLSKKLSDLLSIKMTEGLDEMVLRRKEEQFLKELVEAGAFIIKPDETLIH